MFFEPLPKEAGPANESRPMFPEWAAPPSTQTGAVVAIDRVVAQSENVTVVLPMARVFRTGCLLDVEVVSRRGGLSDDDWWNLSWSAHGFGLYHGGPLPDRMLRMGVRYGDGTKATTVDHQRRRASSPDSEPPASPVLSSMPTGSGIRGGGAFGLDNFAVWLWPLPPAKDFEFAVEWPLGGIELTIVELDGAAIAAAAERSRDFWPGSGGDSPSQ